ncbi:hypothetical protein CVT26_010182 [Gymnopilus dilepis]|uniref:Uncharacterized protein n=1 Tax=Gymnopilus dilepis TaxID=231916 RepID=A0A409W4M2_9AGAR|nr:hypothetical protein CVT26_010182 [Gymnopilus dilepis]
MSSDLESTLAQIRELKLQLSGGTPSDPKNAQTNLDPKHKNESTSGQATAANSKLATSKDAASMSAEKQGDDTGSTSRAAGALAGSTGDNARPTSNLIHSDSRDNTHDGFGGCSSPCNRYGEQTQQDSQQPGSLSPSTSHTATIPESKGVVNSENPNRPHGQDVENTSPFVSTPEKEVKDKKDEAVETRADESESSAPKESHVPPESHAAVASTSKPSPYPIGPGDQVIEHVKRIHQGGMAPGPDGKPTPTPGKTLLTTISSQGTTYALSDKDLPPGQQVVETLETIYEGFELPGTEGSATLAPATPNKRRWSWFAPMSSPGSAKASPAKGANAMAAAPPSGPSDAQTPAGPTEGAPATPERPGQQKVKSGFLDTLIGRSPSKRSEEKARSQEPVVAESAPPPSAAAPEAQTQETTNATANVTSPAVGPSDVEQPPSSQAPEAAPSPNVGASDRPAQQRGWSGFLESLKARSPSKHAKAEQGNVQQFEHVAEAPETAPAPPSNVQSQEAPKPAVINLNEEPPTNPQQPAQDSVSPTVDASQRPAQPRGRSGLFGTLVGRSKEKGKGREPEGAAEGAPESSPASAAPEGQSQEVKSAAAVNPAEVALPASPKEEEPPHTPAADVAERPAQQRGRPSFFETLIGRSPGKHAREKGKAGEPKFVEAPPPTASSASNVETQKPPNAEAIAAEVSDVLKAGEVEDQDPGAVPALEPSTLQSPEAAHAPQADQANVESTAKPQATEGTLSPNVAADERPPQTKKRSSFFGGLIKSPSKHVYEEKAKAEKLDSAQQEPAAAPLPAGPKEESQNTSTASATNPPPQPATAETLAAPQTAEEAPSPSPNVKSGFLDTLMGRSPSKHVDKGKLKEQEQTQPQDTPTSEEPGAAAQAEAPSVPQTSAQDQGTAGAPSPEHHWFDRFLDGLGGRKEKVVS